MTQISIVLRFVILKSVTSVDPPQTPRRSSSRKRSVYRPWKVGSPDCCWYHSKYCTSCRSCRKPFSLSISRSSDTKNFGKILCRLALRAIVRGWHSRLLYKIDLVAKTLYFVNFSAEVSILFVCFNYRLREPIFNLQASNGKVIVIYCNRCVYPHVGLHGLVHWIFVIADVLMPVIGIDVVHHHNLLIETWKRRLVDGGANLSVCVTSFSLWRLYLVTVKYMPDPHYQWMLDMCPELYHSRSNLPCVTSDVAHHNATTWPLFFRKRAE